MATRCPARFIKQKLKDPVQEARMGCAMPEGHRGRHRNLDRDLFWHVDLEVDVQALLDDEEDEPPRVS